MAYNCLDSKLLKHPEFSEYLHEVAEMEQGQTSSADGSKSILQNGSASHTNGFHKQNGTASTVEVESNRQIGEIQIPVPWGQISAKTHGSPSGQRVLAVHGWMDNAGTFDRLIPLLSETFYIVAVDMPGHGLSSHIPVGSPYHFADFIISLRRIVNYLQWTKFSWLGHSMGAGLGAMYAASFPTQVEHLIMIDLTKPITGDSGSDYAAKIAIAVDHFLSLEEKIEPFPPTHTYEEALTRIMNGMWATLTEESAKILMVRGARQVGEDQWCFVRDLRLRSPSVLRLSHDQCNTILSKIRSATMIIKASEAPWFDPQEVCETAMDIYRKNCAVFKFVTVEGDHFVHLNDPEKIADCINEFLIEC